LKIVSRELDRQRGRLRLEVHAFPPAGRSRYPAGLTTIESVPAGPALRRMPRPGRDDEVRRIWDNGTEWVRSRGFVIERVYSHDVYHCAELNEVLGFAGLPLIDLWD
jgi:hypothetical protein